MYKLSLFALLALVVATLAGCPKDTCLLKVCKGNVCRCHWSTCVDGATFDTNQNRCVCVAGRFPVAGQCLTQAAADAYCGVGYRFGPQGCARIECGPEAQLDEATGHCVPLSQVAGNVGVQVGQGEKLGCPPGSELVIEGNTAACVPVGQTCAPDETWDGQQCVKQGQCPTGWRYDPTLRQCIEFAKTGDDVTEVNVMQWAQSTYGPNGGQGTSTFCSKFARKPWRFGVPEEQSTLVQVEVQLGFPDQNVSAGAVVTKPSYVGVSYAVPAGGAESVQQAAQDLFTPLQMGGGKASAVQASTTVRCAVVNAAKPVAVPATGGF